MPEEPDFTDEQLEELERWQEEEAQKLAIADSEKMRDKTITSTLRDIKGSLK